MNDLTKGTLGGLAVGIAGTLVVVAGYKAGGTQEAERDKIRASFTLPAYTRTIATPSEGAFKVTFKSTPEYDQLTAEPGCITTKPPGTESETYTVRNGRVLVIKGVRNDSTEFAGRSTHQEANPEEFAKALACYEALKPGIRR